MRGRTSSKLFSIKTSLVTYTSQTKFELPLQQTFHTKSSTVPIYIANIHEGLLSPTTRHCMQGTRAHRAPPSLHPASPRVCRRFGERRRNRGRSPPPHERRGRAASAAIIGGAWKVVVIVITRVCRHRGWTREPSSLRFAAVRIPEGVREWRVQGGRCWINIYILNETKKTHNSSRIIYHSFRKYQDR